MFVVREERARVVPVELGATDGDWTAVERGLSAGDVVVAHPSDQIRDGVRVRARSRS